MPDKPNHYFMHITILSGSPRQHSITRRVALHLYNRLQRDAGNTVQLVDLKDWNLPPLEKVFTSVENTPEAFAPLSTIMFATDVFIIVSPEYNGSYSPALKNLLDHFPKQEHKVFGIVTATTGALGGMRAAQQLLLLVPALFGIAVPQLLLVPHVEKTFAENGELLDPAFDKNITTFLTEFTWLSERVCSWTAQRCPALN